MLILLGLACRTLLLVTPTQLIEEHDDERQVVSDETSVARRVAIAGRDVYGVSISTAQRVQLLLKERGLAVGRPGDGVYVAA